MTSLHQNRIYHFGEFRLHADEHLFLRGEERVLLSPRNFDLLVKLVEHSGHLLTKENLVNEVWGDSFVEEGNLNRTISSLRKALGEKPNENRFIETIPRVGYRFVAPVELVYDKVKLVADLQAESHQMGQAEAYPTDGQAKGYRTEWLLSRLPVALAAGLVLIAAFGLYLWRTRGHEPAAAPAETNRYDPIALSPTTTEDTGAHWTRDGRVRFLRVGANRQTASWIMNADGTNQTQVKDFPNLQWGVWSPDGQKVIFGKLNDRSACYLANADGSNETALPFFALGEWSPDSEQIVYQNVVDSNSAIFLYSLESRESKNISNNSWFDADPSFSPDGKQITFVSARDGNLEIYVMNVDGSSPTRLTNHLAVDSHPAFSPDGTQILFSSDRDKEHSDVYIVNADGSGEPINLVNWEESDQYAGPGCWSADGTKILFMSNRTGIDRIYVTSAEAIRPQKILAEDRKDLQSPSYSADGKSIAYQVQLEDKSSELHIWNVETKRDSLVIRTKRSLGDTPAWSPRSDWIAFTNQIEGQSDICLIRPDGSGLKNLTQNPAKDGDPTWSPDGKQIAFVSNRDGNYGVSQIYAMNADGSGQRRIYYSQAMSLLPSWSPDGKQIVFANDKEDNRSGNFEIFIIEPDTGEPERRLTFRPRVDSHPVFSPSGKRIVFASNADGNFEIYLINTDGTGLLRLTRDPAEDVTPHWSPDETRIIFSSNRDGKFALYELTVPR